MYRDRLTQNRSRELVAGFLDDFLAQRGWWAARAAWVDERDMVIDPWRVSSAAPSALDPLRRHTDPVDPVDPGAERYPEPAIVPVSAVRCTRALVDDFAAAGVDELIVVDVAGVGPFDLRLVFAVDAAQRRSPDGIEALRTGAALLPTLIRQEGERDALRLGALRDALTGLLNRPGLDELAAQRPNGSFLRAVIYLDLDGFKAVNDAHGHGAGDEVLVGTAQRLVAQVRPHDLVARLGGDEFVIVAEQVLDETSVVSLSQRIIGAVSHDLVLESGAVVAVAASAGVALWPEGEPLEAIIATADGLMYEAKRIGGGIAMHDGAGRILVRDPLDGRAVPEEVERGRAPVRALPLDPLGDAVEGGAHVVLRGELCTVAADEAAETVLDALRPIDRARPADLVIEPRGRGWARDGVLADLVAAIRDRRPASRLTLLVDAQPSAIELRLAAEELRALGLASVALGGVGAVHGGDLRMIAQVSPTLISLDHEAVLNLTRTSPAGLVARLAAALAQTVAAPLLVVEPPVEVSDDTLRAWGASAVARALDRA